ncbi:hypothetical protein ACJIZ3_002818 [Penstemon smallii]|uniref:SHSP domain-containing protein n=1 Tax=Penstemon smallii TaxID=265156 RepID=A0ABD3U8V0_9LAMI
MFFASLHTCYFILLNNISVPCVFLQLILQYRNFISMDLEFTRVADEFNSDFQIAKSGTGPLFLSRETDTMFVLTAHLKGYKRTNIKIDTTEDGTLMAISGEKHVKETVIVGSKVYKKNTEIKGLKKVFRIPGGVILDKMSAKFNEDESTLTVSIPKKVKGIRGTAIEEVKVNKEFVNQGSRNLQIMDEKIQERNEYIHDQDYDESMDMIVLEKQEQQENSNQVLEKTKGIREEEKQDDIDPRRVQEGKQNPEGKICKMCTPMIAGSALLVSILVFVFHVIRSKNQTKKKKD